MISRYGARKDLACYRATESGGSKHLIFLLLWASANVLMHKGHKLCRMLHISNISTLREKIKKYCFEFKFQMYLLFFLTSERKFYSIHFIPLKNLFYVVLNTMIYIRSRYVGYLAVNRKCILHICLMKVKLSSS